MNLLPEWVRPELYHPLTVHFPVALLPLAMLAFLTALFLPPDSFIRKTGSVMLILGVVMAWLAIYTGDMADGIVSRKLCDPTVLKEHENFAFITAWTFSAAAMIEIIISFNLANKFSGPLKILVIIITVAGTGLLIYAADHGASLVYEQAAGVSVPSDNCEEFN